MPLPAETLVAHLDELERYNEVLGLSAHNEKSGFIGKLVWESVLLSVMVGSGFTGRIADLGGGNGYPGLVIAAMHPEASVLIIEASENRCAFLDECILAMKLGNASVEHRFLKSVPEILKDKFEIIAHLAFSNYLSVLKFAGALGKDGHSVIGVIPEHALDCFSLEIKRRLYKMESALGFINLRGNRSVAYRIESIRPGNKPQAGGTA